MAKWNEFVKELEEVLHVDEITEDIKQEFARWLLETVLPAVEKAAADFVTQIKKQAGTERGWCKVRDAIVLPLVTEGGLWLVRKALEKSLEPEAAR